MEFVSMRLLLSQGSILKQFLCLLLVMLLKCTNLIEFLSQHRKDQLNPSLVVVHRHALNAYAMFCKLYYLYIENAVSMIVVE